MAIRISKEETFSVQGNVDEIRSRIVKALMAGGFTRINEYSSLNHVTANYKKFTVWGEIKISLIHENDIVKVNAVSTANVDNIFALFSSPNQKILDQFKNYFR